MLWCQHRPTPFDGAWLTPRIPCRSDLPEAQEPPAPDPCKTICLARMDELVAILRSEKGFRIFQTIVPA